MAHYHDTSANSLFKGMYSLFLGAGSARILGIMSMPVLSRVYEPEAFGLLAVFTALTLQIMPVLSWRYAVALPLTRSTGEALNLVVLSFALIFVSALVVAVCLWFFSENLLTWLKAENLLSVWWLIPIGAVIMAAFDLLLFWSTGMRAYGKVAQAQFIMSCVGESCKIGLGAIGWTSLGLLSGYLVSQISGSMFLVRQLKYSFRHYGKAVRFSRICVVAKRYLGFPLYRFPSQILLGLATQLPILFIAALYDPATTGQFALAMTALSLPLNLIGRTMAQAYYGEVSNVRKDPKLVWEISVSVQRRLIFLGIPFAIFLSLYAESIFSIVFGDRWSMAGRFTEIFSFVLMFQVTSAPLLQIENLMEKKMLFVCFNIFRISGIVFVYYLGAYFDLSATQFITILSYFLTAFYCAITFYLMRMLWVAK